jgi:hypothetical protein
MYHYLQDIRSLDMHRMLAQRLRENPDLIAKLQAQFDHWDSLPGTKMAANYRQAWLEAIDAGVEAVYRLATEDSDRGQVLRSCSPFAVLWDSSNERLTFLKDWQKEHRDIMMTTGSWQSIKE